jgi:hypothetical protein
MSIEHWRNANDKANQPAHICIGQSGPGKAYSRNTAVPTVNYHSTDVPHSFICHPEMEQFSHHLSRSHRDIIPPQPGRNIACNVRATHAQIGQPDYVLHAFPRFINLSLNPTNSVTSVQQNLIDWYKKRSWFPK